MIDSELLKIMCCPETHQPLEFADEETIKKINSEIKSGIKKNRSGELIKEEIDGGLIREDKKFLYPIRKGIPIMLIDEAIPLD